jgi:hypothetical protein
VVSDPVVASLPQPGGNITSFINLEGSLGSKWIELLLLRETISASRLRLHHLQPRYGSLLAILPASVRDRRSQTCG